jgi:hypothetical protein
VTPVYSSQLIVQQGYSGALAFVYAAPAGFVVAVKDITMVVGANAVPGGMYVAHSTGAKLSWYHDNSVPADVHTEHLYGQWVLDAGESLGIATEGGWTCDFFVSGYVLSLP